MPRLLLAFALLLLLPLGAVGCAVSEKDELQLGLDNHGKFEAESGGRYADPTVQTYVNTIGVSLARYAGRPEMNWQFHVLNSDQVNAFAVPGGYIYITQGLLFRMQNEAQLAGVLGHEAAHIAHRHSAKQIETSRGVAVGTAGVSVLASLFGYEGVGNLASIGAQLGMASYSRAHETEADMSGLKYMAQAGYNPTGMVGVMQVLKAAAGGAPGGPLGEWTSSHPDPGNRIEYLTDAIKSDATYTALTRTGKVGQQEFQTNVLSRRRAPAPKAHTGPTAPDALAALGDPMLWCLTCRWESARATPAAKNAPQYGPATKGWGAVRPAAPLAVASVELLRDAP